MILAWRKGWVFKAVVLAGAGITASCVPARAQLLDQIGVTLLRTATNLDGTGVRVGLPEAAVGTSWQVNPAYATVRQPVERFIYYSSNGIATNFPNDLGTESGHADNVAGILFGNPGGVATNVVKVDNFDADFFFNNYIISNAEPVADAVVNQSFTFGNVTNVDPVPDGCISVDDQQALDTLYDNYAVAHGTLFISAVNNSGSVSPPGTAYNSLGVGACGPGAASSIGPTVDNGRCKPDLVAPQSVTSFAAPQVAGAAALLLQAAMRGDGGAATNAAADPRTIKALLMNGAIKPPDWKPAGSAPLDARYGAGVLNVFNAWRQFAGGRQPFTSAEQVAGGGNHPPAGVGGAVAVLNGWDFNTNTSHSASPAQDGVNHYLFNATNGMGFTLTATLVWNRHLGKTAINNLDLFLYDCASGRLVASSTSRVDNVEHLFVPRLAPGRYDLQVWKAGAGAVSDTETYALAFAFTSPTLTLTPAGTNLWLTWPAYPAGFVAEASQGLTANNWSTNSLPPVVFTNGQNTIRLNATHAVQFFRLRQGQ